MQANPSGEPVVTPSVIFQESPVLMNIVTGKRTVEK
jgi:hypothetical protein